MFEIDIASGLLCYNSIRFQEKYVNRRSLVAIHSLTLDRLVTHSIIESNSITTDYFLWMLSMPKQARL